MLFTSVSFVIFVAAVLLMYYIVPKKWQWIMLLCANVCFYLQAGVRGAIFMIATIISTYFCSRMIEKASDRQKLAMEKLKDLMTKEQKKAYKAKTKKNQRMWMVLCILFNFGILAVLKYTNLFISFTSLKPVNFILPMGISFYTFQSMGYIIDVYRGVTEAENNIFKFALFVSFFPQLMQGPISRWKDLKETLFEEHSFSWERFESGIQRIIWGYFKKMVIADRAAIGLATITSDFSKYTGAYAFLGMLIYAVELYADFTGGIDITIGIAELFGIRLPENFRQPFFSKSLAEYWRRWHITLCAWFKDYVFYPISMSKKMNKASKWLKKHVSTGIGQRFPIYTATIVVWFVTGMWHGASWNFVLWGVYYGLFLLLEKFVLQKYLKKIPSWLCTVYTMLVVMIGWVFFSQTDFGALGHYLGTMFGIGASGFIDKTALYYLKTGFILLLISILMCRPAPYQYFKCLVRRRPVAAVIINLILFALSIAYMVYNSYTPFLYAKF